VTAVISSQCFNALISVPPNVSSNYLSPLCIGGVDVITGLCFTVTFTTDTIEYSPPFFYSFQCSSSLLTLFSYIFIYRYVISGLIEPLLIVLLKYIQYICIEDCPVQSGDEATSPSSDSITKSFFSKEAYLRMFEVVTNLFPTLWKMVDIEGSKETGLHPIKQQMIDYAFVKEEDSVSLQRIYFLRQSMVVSIGTDWTVMLCFGGMFPPLAIVIAISAWKDTTQWKIALNCMLQRAHFVNDEETLHAHLTRY
jgi:hypothetical protein